MSHLRCRWAFVALLPCAVIGTAFSEAGTSSGQNLSEVDVFAYPWSAIGKLNNSVGGSCTCTAVKQDLVLTAAHCIFNRRTGRFLQPSSLHLLFGYRRGEYAMHARVAEYTLGPGCRSSAFSSSTRFTSIAAKLPLSISS
jgi:protease YdgD